MQLAEKINDQRQRNLQTEKTFNDLTAVNQFDINVEPREIFALLGPNGAGKNTTISMLCTILKSTSGNAKVNGYDIVKKSTPGRKSLGIVFQGSSINHRLTVL